MTRSAKLLCLSVSGFAALVGCGVFGGGGVPGQQIGNSFATATPVTLDADGKAALGSSLAGNKIDVYDIGPCNPGDRIIASIVPTTGSFLDPVMAIFDANEDLFILNDDVDFASGRLDSAVDEVVSVASPKFYLAVSKFAFSGQDGAYLGSLEVQRGVPIPPPFAQVILLNFAGGSVDIPSEGTINVDPFDAADIDPIYAGQTMQIKNTIINTVKENFAEFGVVIATSDDPSPPANPFSTIEFGAFSGTKFGIAQSVDAGNLDRCDDGIVFTDNFDDPFLNQPDVVGIGVAIGNVAAHEAGHLLGLNHVADILDLMDTTGSASTLLADQTFQTSPLSTSIFPIGNQNAPAILNRIIPPPP